MRIGALLRAGAASLLLLAATPGAATDARRIEVEGLSAVRQGDVAEARRQALADALQQAMLETGARLDSQSFTNAGALTADQLHVAASGRLLSHKIIDEVREGDMLRLRVEALLAPEGEGGAPCSAAASAVYVLPLVYDIDPSLDPAVWEPALADVDRWLSGALGARPLMAPVATRYEALLQPRGAAPAAGLLANARLTIQRRAVAAFPISGVPTDHAVATLVVDVIDTASGARVAYHQQRRDWSLTRRMLDLLPAGINVRQQQRTLPLAKMIMDAAPALRAQMACRTPAVPITRVDGAEMVLGAGTGVGLRRGDVLRVGEDGGVQLGSGTGEGKTGWVLAQVVDVSPESARARLLDPSGAGRLRAAPRIAYSLR